MVVIFIHYQGEPEPQLRYVNGSLVYVNTIDGFLYAGAFKIILGAIAVCGLEICGKDHPCLHYLVHHANCKGA